MCTLAILWMHHPAAPLVLALNRDEFLARPTEPVSRWTPEGATASIVSGRDLQSGGTWFAVGARVTAALTNHRSGRRSLPGERSRGDLVVHAALAGDVGEADARIATLDPAEFGPFHLMACDGERLFWWTNRDGEMESHEVAPGVHVLGNYGMDNEKDPVVISMRERLDGIGGLDVGAMGERLRAALADHGPGRPCVHLGPYGTRTSALLLRGGGRDSLLVTEGAPCENPWTDRSELLAPDPKERTAES